MATNFVGSIQAPKQNLVSERFARWRRTIRSASAALDAGEPINNN